MTNYQVGSVSDYLSGKQKKPFNEKLTSLFSSKVSANNAPLWTAPKETELEVSNSLGNHKNDNNNPEFGQSVAEKFKNRKGSKAIDSNSDQKLILKPTDRVLQRERKKLAKKKKVLDVELNKRTVFVGNVSLLTTKKKLGSIFAKYGQVESVRFRNIPVAKLGDSKRVAATKQEFHPGRSSKSAFVRFVTVEACWSALNANGLVIDDHHIQVTPSTCEKIHDHTKAVFVGNLPFDTEEEELWTFFEECGKIKDIRIIRDSETAIGKGFAYVNFKALDAIELALQKNGEHFKNREIRVKRSIGDQQREKMKKMKEKKLEQIAIKTKTKTVMTKRANANDSKKTETKKKFDYAGERALRFRERKALLKKRKQRQPNRDDKRRAVIAKKLAHSNKEV